jgi:hypothetical protein
MSSHRSWKRSEASRLLFFPFLSLAHWLFSRFP